MIADSEYDDDQDNGNLEPLQRKGVVDDILAQVQAKLDPAQRAELIKQMEEAARVDHLARVREMFRAELVRYGQLREELAEVEERLATGVKAYADDNNVAVYFDSDAEGHIVFGTSKDSKTGEAKMPTDYAAIGRKLPAATVRLSIEIDKQRIEADMKQSSKVVWNGKDDNDPPAWRRAVYKAQGKDLPKGNPLNDIKVWYQGKWVAFSAFKNALERNEVTAEDLAYPAPANNRVEPLKLAA